MIIRSITVDNFKSLIDFKADLAKFTCLIGLNGVGKTTVLQLIDFLSQQVRGKIEDWLAERSWKSRDLTSRLGTKKNIEFSAVVSAAEEGEYTWEATFNTTQLYCTSERIKTPDAQLEVSSGSYTISTTSAANGAGKPKRHPIEFDYQGSILSQLRGSFLPDSLLTFKRFIEGVKAFDLLSPHLLRQRTRESGGSLGLGGERLSAFLHELGKNGRQELAGKLRPIYEQLQTLESKSLRSGWKQLEVRETFGGKQIVTEARHINDGMLRQIAILAELQTDHTFLLFDEIENGINPEVVEFVVNLLVAAPQQVLVTTHSPLVLNYLDDDVAQQGVLYLYKTPAGRTRVIPFFAIPSLAEKLTVMGPGEALVDTNLTALAQEIAELRGEE
jgi:predicted ATPase